VAKEPSFHFQAIYITGEAAVFANDAVARDDDRKRIEAIGMTYRSYGIVVIDDIGYIRIGPGATIRYELNHLPDFFVEVRCITKIKL
jgi:chromosomal replication initiation ATPase DnaA